MATIAFALLAFAVPALTQLARDRVRTLSFLNPLLASYALGIALGNTLLRGQAAFQAFDLVTTVTVGLSIPLLLFTLDVRSWGKVAGRMMLGIALACVAVVIALAAGAAIFPAFLPDYPKLAGLLVGVYTGGTPNLAALRLALRVDNDLYLAVHAADVAVGALYILFFIGPAKKVFGLILKPAEPSASEAAAGRPGQELYDEVAHKRFPFIGEVLRASRLGALGLNVGLAVACVGLAFGLSLLAPEASRTMILILALTSAAVALSFVRRVREASGSFELGEYLILVFCFAAGAMGDVRRVLEAGPAILALVAYAVVVSVALHALLCRLFGLDRDTMMIASTAAVCSPPFVGIVAGALGNRRLIAPGIAAGLAGYALGNYLGILTYQILSAALG